MPGFPYVTLRDPVHGDIELTRDEVRILDTVEVQRLRGIKQLGTAYLVFPGAVHSRFEHSIGTLHMTQRLVDAANRNAERDPGGCRPIAVDEARVLRIAALLHDVTHVPFGHNIEDQTGLLPRHDVPSRFRSVLAADTELGAVLDGIGVRDDVLAVLGAARDGGDRAVPPFWRQALSDTIDADLMDYLRRDAFFTGLELSYDQRVVGYFRIDRATERMFVDCEKNGMLREDIVSELTRVLEMRYHFSERVYYHHAKVAAGALVARMVELALRGGGLDQSTLQTCTDQSLLDLLGRIELEDAATTERLRRFAARFARRQLPKRVLVLPEYLNREVQQVLLDTYFKPGAAETRFAWESALEAEAKRAFGQDLDVIMYCPARRMQLKEARTLVRFPGQGDRICELGALADEMPRLRDLEQRYPRLWKLYVFTSAEDHDVRAKLQQMCLDALPPGCVNALSV